MNGHACSRLRSGLGMQLMERSGIKFFFINFEVDEAVNYIGLTGNQVVLNLVEMCLN